MNTVLHIIKKDIRHLRWALPVWALIITMHVALSIAQPSLEMQGNVMSIVFGQMMSLVSLVQLVVMVLIVSWLVHEDPAADRDAFWLTRPIPAAQLAGAKLILAGALLIALPLAGEAVTMAVFRMPAYDMWRAAPAILLNQATWTVALVAAAAMAPSITRYILILVAAAAAYVLLTSATIAGMLLFADVRQSPPRPELIDPIPGIIVAAVMAGTSVWVVFFQYRQRRLRTAAAAATVGLVMTMAVPWIWPSRLSQAPDSDPGAWAHDEQRTAAMFRSDPPKVSDEISFTQRRETRKQVAIPVQLAGLPDDMYVEAVQAHSRLVVGGTALDSTQTELVNLRRKASTDTPHDATSALRSSLGNPLLLGWEAQETYELWPAVLTITDDEFARFGRTTGRLTSTLDFYVARSTVDGSFPLSPGVRMQDDTRRIEIARLERRVDGCTVRLREISVYPLIRRQGYHNETFVLRNAARGEVVRGDVQYMEQGSTSPLSFLLAVAMGPGSYGGGAAGTGFGVRSYAYRFPGVDRSAAGGPAIDDAWLSGAELVRVRTVLAGRVTRTINIDDFAMVR
jgi:hypothetical protein